jgi:hypothetical protein
VDECGVDPQDVWILGRSLGTGPATKLAAAVEKLDGKQLGGVILHSPFTSIKEAGIALLGNVAHIMHDRWDNRIWIKEYKARTLIVHALEDEVVPYEHARELESIRLKAGLPCKLHSTHGTHNYFSYYKDYLQPILDFIEEGIKPGKLARKVPALADPIPRAQYSEAQVQRILALVKEQKSNVTTLESEKSNELRFYGMVDSMGETIPREVSPTTRQSGFSRFGSSSDISSTASVSTSFTATPEPLTKTRSISPSSTILGPTDAKDYVDEEMILTPGGARPRLV